MKKIYLAGPDVFFKNATEHFAELKRLCTKYGLVGISPLDGESDGQELTAQLIFEENIKKMQSCDGALANMNPFRGQFEPDSGTAFETGFLYAMKKPVALYIENIATLKSKLIAELGSTKIGNHDFDLKYGMAIEDFDLPLNLMMAVPFPIYASADEALKELAKQI